MDTALADIVRATRATGAMLYVLTPDRTALWLSHVAGAPREVVAPWSRVAVDDPIPVADAVREERLVWVNSQEEM
ncbi:PAS sensor protein, partial [Streptomyces sp. SID4956]|nr:PAS sensor protein [Streptomyces sp. SID4956]